MRSLFRFITILSILLGVLSLAGFSMVQLVAAQLPTETLQPTATFGGPTVFAPEQVNIRTGPHTSYEQVGVLIAGQTAPAIGRTQVGEWIQIEYPGAPGGKAWVKANLVALRAGTIDDLPVVEAPPTATPPPTLTPLSGGVAPGTPEPTRLPTFTAAPPILQPTFTTPDLGGGGFPPAILIIGLFMIGLFAAIVVVLRQRV